MAVHTHSIRLLTLLYIHCSCICYYFYLKINLRCRPFYLLFSWRRSAQPKLLLFYYRITFKCWWKRTQHIEVSLKHEAYFHSGTYSKSSSQLNPFIGDVKNSSYVKKTRVEDRRACGATLIFIYSYQMHLIFPSYHFRVFLFLKC